MEQNSYDLIILGGGPGGYLAAERAGHAGLHTLLIEKKMLGGVCLNEGCISSKTLLHTAKIYDYALHGEKYGVIVDDAAVKIDQNTVVNRKNKVVKTLVAGIKSVLKANHVTVINGEGVICGKSDDGYIVKVEKSDVMRPDFPTDFVPPKGHGGKIKKTDQGHEDTEQRYTGTYLLIATGSAPVIPPIPGVREGLERGFVLTNREILDLREIPESLVIIGGGVIGLEMASYYHSVGTRVTVIEMLDQIAGQTDQQIAEILMKNYEKKGITFVLNARVTGVGETWVAYEKDGVSKEIEADRVLLSIGRRPVTEAIGLETIGVEVLKNAIRTDRYLQTNIPNVYAAGDVNGKMMLAHTAYREAEVAVNHILWKRAEISNSDYKDEMRYRAIPSVIYTTPEVGSVGETEKTAAEKGIAFEIANVSMRYSGRYLAENEGGDGICKVLIDKKSRRMIGCHLIGSYASEIVTTAAALIETELRVRDIKEIVFPHPSVSEIIREAVFQFDNE